MWSVVRPGDCEMGEHFPTFADRARASTRQAIKNGLASPTHSAHANFFRASITQISAEKRAKKVRFYRNGDRFFQGMTFAVPQEKFRTLDGLMCDLTNSPVCDRTVLPKGVRHIYSLDGKTKITSLDQLVNGECYVCCSTANFQKVDYPVTGMPSWSVQCQGFDGPMDRSLLKPYFTATDGPMTVPDDERDYIRPRLITVIRNGSKPRKAFRILLNKKTAHSLEQVMGEITDTVRLDGGVVKKIYAYSGKQVHSLQDFFKEDDIFFAYGNEKMTQDDLDLSKNEINFVNAYSRSARQQTPLSVKSPRAVRRTFNSSSSSSNKDLTDSNIDGERMYLNGHSKFLRQMPSPPQSPHRRKHSASKSPVLSRAKLAVGNTNGVGDAFSSIPKIIKERYVIGNIIGEGNYAVVRECMDRMSRRQYALKIINKKKCGTKLDMVINEVMILRSMKHHNIVQLIEDHDTTTAVVLVMELVTGGDLFDAITAATQYTEKDASGMLHNLASAVSFLHSRNIVHRDIKPENILLQMGEDGSKCLKLGDFGLAVIVETPLFTVCGTPTYVAPEILAGTGYGLKVDIWSAGIVGYILLCGFPPFSSETNNCEELFEKIRSGKFEFVSPYWDHISDSAKDLISNMLIMDAEERYSADQVLGHRWVQEDIASDADIHESVACKLSQLKNSHPESSCTPQNKELRASAWLTATPLDKNSQLLDESRSLLNNSQHDGIHEEIF